VKKLILITIFILFSSVSFAEVSTDWKWGKVFNSVVLVSGENIAEIIIKDPNEIIPDEGPHEQEPKFDTLKPRLIPYGMGTGFFINKFHIVTNYHVIKNFNKLSIYAFNHLFAITDVTVVGYDEEIDIAVLQINEDIPHDFLRWSDDAPLIGDDVYALGHGMSQVWSLTKGILSYDYRQNPGTSFVHYIQTDAVINSGNSGGPLMNEDGGVIGVSTLLISPDKYYVGYGYVIPTPLVKRAVTQILATGEHVKPFMGILMGHIEDRTQYDELKANEIGHYLEIKEVTKDSPANRFGLKAGDIIISMDDKDIQVVPQVIEFLWERNPGDQVSFKIYRDYEYHIIDLVLGTSKKEPEVVVKPK
jgi:serine protease Do